MANLTNREKTLLNDFADSMPALNDTQLRGSSGLPRSKSAVKLGDLLEKYVPAASADWNGSPSTVQEAIDRLASAVAGLLMTPVP